MATLSELLSQVGEIKKREMASDPFFSVGQSLIGGQLQPSYGYSARDYIGANLAKNLLGGVFQGIAESNATDLSKGINELLPAVLTGKAIAKPDYLSNSQYESALANLAGIKNARDIAQLDEQTDLGNKLAFEIAKTRGVKGAEQDAQLEFLKKILGGSTLAADESTPTVQQGESQSAPIAPISGDMNKLALAAGAVPELKPMLEQKRFDLERSDKQAEKQSGNLLDLEKELRQAVTKGKVPEMYVDIASNFETMKGVFDIDTKAADLALISSFARILDPNSTVREGEINNVSKAQSFLQKIYGEGTTFFNNEGRLKPEFRKGLLESAAVKYNSFGQQYSDLVKRNQQLLESQGGSGQKIIPFEYSPFQLRDFLAQKQLGVKNIDPVTNAALQLKNSGLTREQAFNQLMGIK